MAGERNRTPREVVEDLKHLYRQPFGGKERGRMRISRARLRELSIRGRLEEAFIQELTDVALDEGLVIVNLDDYFAIVKKSTMLRYRSVTKSMLNELKEEVANAQDK